MERIGNTSHELETDILSSVEGSFFVRNQEGLAELFDIVGVPDEALTSIDEAVKHTQPWVKGDHSRPGYQFDISPADNSKLHDLYARFGQKDETMLPSGPYHEIIVPGAVQRGNRRRLELLRRAVSEHEVTTSHITLLGGERRLFPEVEKDDIETTIDTLARRGSLEPWVESVRNMDVANLWETDGMRLAALEQLGPLVLKNTAQSDRCTTTNEADSAEGYEFMWNDIAVSLMHTLAVDRPNGERRHTTEACVRDWLQRHEPPQAARIGFIGANPHLERMGRATRTVLEAEGRGDLQLVVAGSASPPELGHGHYLGEIARNLYQDQHDQHAS
jgi:hypothetical protein